VPVSGDAQSHVELLALASQIRAAARSADVASVHTSLCRLQTELLVHVHAERPQIAQLPVSARSILLDGQARLLGVIGHLLFDSVDTREGCSCLNEALELPTLLARQADLELRLGVVLSNP
jgi:hypothetical protein